MKKVALYNLGCKVNSYETEGMRQSLLQKGYSIVPFDEAADIYIVNTCTVTNIADRKSRQMLHRARQLNPEAIVVAAGCYVQTAQEAVEKDAGIDLAIGNNRKKDIAEILEAFLAGRGDKTLGGTTIHDIGRVRECEEFRLERTGENSREHTRAYIKIQDGCNQFCSYCAIPYARGRVRSRRQEDILDEVRGLAEAGYREVVLTGIHISSYGTDTGESRLVELAGLLQDIPGLERIRLGSLEPRIINQQTAERLADMPKLCPHFHLSLQSGCDATLKRMNRHYTIGEYYESMEALRRYFDRPAITTDVIVGFPGETQEEFGATKDFLEKACFYEMHVFKYSRRKGTRAAAMDGQVGDETKAERSGILLAMERVHSREFRERILGREQEVLFEEEKNIDGTLFQTGHTRQYVKVAKKSEKSLTNELILGKIKGFLSDDMMLIE